MPAVAAYFASIGFQINQASVIKADKVLTDLEIRLKKLSNLGTVGSSKGLMGLFNKPLKLNITGFDVDQAKLNRTIGTALDVASTKVVFEISRFAVNHRNLQMALMAAPRSLQGGSYGGRGTAGLSKEEWDRRQQVMGSAALLRHERSLELAALRKNSLGSSGRVAATAGMGLSPMGVLGPAMALAAGGYGLSRLNKLNQKVVAAELQSQAVVQQVGGTAEEGTDSFNWLRTQANRIGFNYLDATQGYNNTLAGMTHAGMSVQQGQKVFKGFSEIGRVMKLDAVHQKRLLYAVSEVADMNELQKRQMNMIALALPGGKSLFAEAWQKKTGGKLHGQEAEDALLKAIKARKVKGDILLPVAELASERAAPNLAKAAQASQAQQSRYQNAIADLAKVASDAGVEEGFARIFRTLTAGLNESNGLVRDLAEYFNEATKYASELLLFPQSFVRALEGKDSLVADWLGVDKTKQLQEDWKDVKQIFKDISGIQFDFLPTLHATALEIAKIMGAIADFQRWKENLVASPNQDQSVSFLDRPITATYQTIGKLFNGFDSSIDSAKERGDAVNNPASLFYHKPDLYDDNQKNMAMDMAANQAQEINNKNTVDITIKIDPTTLASEDSSKLAKFVGDAVKDHIGDMFGQVQDKFPAK
jgi:hypothetical protein